MKRNIIITIIGVLILTCLFAFARTTTTDLALVKPTWSENVDILDDLNANSDILEAFANDVLEHDLSPVLRAALDIATFDIEGVDATEFGYLNGISSFGGTLIDDANATAARVTLELVIGSNVQAYDAGLLSIAGLTTAANKSIYTTALDTYAVYDLTAFARTILDDAAATNVRDTLGLTIGTNVEAHDDGLLSIAGLTTAANKSIYTTALDVYAVYDLTAAGRAILDDADASAQRTTLGLVIGTNVQASDASLTSIAGLTYASPSFIKVTAEDTYAIRTIAETKTDLSLNNVTNDAQIAKSIGTAQGDLIYFTGSATPTVLAKGAATQVLTMNAGATAPEWSAAGGGYTNLTSFVDQTAWRVFYSNAAGDVTELALGADGTYLKSNGAAAAPTFATPAGSGTVTTSGTPVDDDYAKFTTATAIEGRSYAEMKTDLGYMTDLVDDTTPDLGGELDAGAHSIGFTQQSTTGDGTTTINWTLGNKFKFTFGAQNDTFTFTAPTNPCNVLLVLIQDGTGSRLATWPGTVKWAGGTAPTLTTGAGTIDICSFYWDGSNYFGVASLAFAVP